MLSMLINSLSMLMLSKCNMSCFDVISISVTLSLGQRDLRPNRSHVASIWKCMLKCFVELFDGDCWVASASMSRKSSVSSSFRDPRPSLSCRPHLSKVFENLQRQWLQECLIQVKTFIYTASNRLVTTFFFLRSSVIICDAQWLITLLLQYEVLGV